MGWIFKTRQRPALRYEESTHFSAAYPGPAAGAVFPCVAAGAQYNGTGPPGATTSAAGTLRGARPQPMIVVRDGGESIAIGGSLAVILPVRLTLGKTLIELVSPITRAAAFSPQALPAGPAADPLETTARIPPPEEPDAFDKESFQSLAAAP